MNLHAERLIANELGCTPVGLRLLAWAVAHDGEAKSTGGPNAGSARTRLVNDGLVVWVGVDVGYQITDAGREIVRRARAMGW